MARGSRSVSRYSTPRAVISTAALASLLDSSRRVASQISSYANSEYRGRTPRAPFQSGALRTRTRTASRRSSMSTSTPGGTTRLLRRGGGAPSSRSTGFFKKGSKKKKYMKKKLIKKSLYGTNRTLEAGKVQTGTDCVWVGHHTAPRRTLLRQAFLSLIYTFFHRSKKISEGAAENSPIRGLQSAGTPLPLWKLGIQYKMGETGAILTETQADLQNKTLAQITDWFMENARPWNNVSSSYDAEFLEFTLIQSPDGVGQDINLYVLNVRDCKIDMFVKSTMKIQNRSKAAAAGADIQDDMDQVDNVPIHGKSYSGKGNSLIAKRSANESGTNPDLNGDQDWGVILGSETENSRKEPPQPSEFRNVKYSGKIHLDPGFIKTSVLTSKFKMYFNTFFKKCQKVDTQDLINGVLHGTFAKTMGKFRVFAAEKMIDTGAAEVISVAFETNTEVSAKVTVHSKTPGVVKSFVKQVLN